MIEKITSKKGFQITKINGYMCHSIYDPIKEAKKFVEKNIEDVQIHFVYGYGDGYIVDEFLERASETNTFYVVVDPFIEISNVENENLAFISFKNSEDLKKNLSYFMNYNYNKKVTTSLNYDKMDLKLYKEFLDILNELIHVNKVNENTVSLFSYNWYINYLKNLSNVDKDESIEKLHNCTDKPIVIASGGPSLTKQLDIIKKYRDKILLIAAGSTINSLLAENIRPDVVVSIDGHINNYAHFKDNRFDEKTLFIYSMYSYPKIREQFEKGYFFVDSASSNLVQHLKKYSQENPIMLNGGGSVAHYALSVGSYISSGPICLIGQDLAYTNGQSHAKSNVFNKKVDKIKDNLIEVDGYFGDKVLSDYMFISMRNVFENLFYLIERKEIYNCTEGGANIKNYTNLPFAEFCEKFIINKSFKECVLVENQTSKDNVIKYFKLEKENYKKIKKYASNNLQLLKTNKANASFKGSVLKKMDMNDKNMKKYISKTPIEIAFKFIEMKVNRSFKKGKNETPKQEFDRVYNQNEFLYKEMKEVSSLGIQTIESIVNEKEGN